SSEIINWYFSLLAQDGDLPFSPVLGILIGATLTIIVVIVLVIVRVRRAQSQPEAGARTEGVRRTTQQHHVVHQAASEECIPSGRRRTRPGRHTCQIRVIDPSCSSSPEGDSDRHAGALNGPQAPPRWNPHGIPQLRSIERPRASVGQPHECGADRTGN
ncbi:hypothetical protein NQ318_018719, partial [Aromia moschata]